MTSNESWAFLTLLVLAIIFCEILTDAIVIVSDQFAVLDGYLGLLEGPAPLYRTEKISVKL